MCMLARANRHHMNNPEFSNNRWARFARLVNFSIASKFQEFIHLRLRLSRLKAGASRALQPWRARISCIRQLLSGLSRYAPPPYDNRVMPDSWRLGKTTDDPSLNRSTAAFGMSVECSFVSFLNNRGLVIRNIWVVLNISHL
jgi:hypothetical protein